MDKKYLIRRYQPTTPAAMEADLERIINEYFNGEIKYVYDSYIKEGENVYYLIFRKKKG